MERLENGTKNFNKYKPENGYKRLLNKPILDGKLNKFWRPNKRLCSSELAVS